MKLENLFFEEHPNPMFIFNLESLKILRVNKSAIKKYGYSRNRFLELTIKNISPEADISKLNQVIGENSTGILDHGYHRHLKKSGEILHVNITAQNFEYRGKRTRLVHIHDITKIVNLKNKYKSTLDELNHHIDENPLAMVKFDQNLQIEKWSKRAEEEFGFSKVEVLEHTSQEVGLFREGEQDFVKNEIQKLVDGGVDKTAFNTLAYNKKGEQIHVRVNATALRDEKDDLKSIVAFIENVTFQKRIELLFKTTEEMAQIGGWEYNPNTEQLFWTDEVYRIYEVPKGEKMSLNKALEFYIPEDRKKLNEELDRIFKKNESYDSEYQIVTKNGRKKWVRAMGQPIIRNNNLYKITGTVQDITDLKLREAEINQNAKEKEVLLAEIHHRVKNNLAIISGLLELKAMGMENTEMKKILRQSQLRIKSMAMIHESLYEAEDFTDLEFSDFSSNLIKAIEEVHGSQEKDISIDVRCDESVELNVNQAIPSGLILNELVTNAFKHAFTDQEKGRITVNIQTNRGKVAIEVSDNGKGLPTDFIDGNMNSLGLTLIHQLTNQLNGEVAMVNSAGGRVVVQFEKKDKSGSSSQNFNFS